MILIIMIILLITKDIIDLKDIVKVYSSAANVSFNLFGVETS